MSALTVGRWSDYGDGWEGLLALWEDTDAPEGCRVELVEGTVTVAPPPSKSHTLITSRVHQRLLAMAPSDWGVFQNLGLAVPPRAGLYVPDLVVAPDAALLGEGTWIRGHEAALVIEITSPGNARHDRVTKTAGYAQAGVPLYLLIDQWATDTPELILYGEPETGVYRTLWSGKAGESVPMPEPFGRDLVTGDFPTPAP
ncbi:Uma2 family endonuclease [Streptomyces sp. IF17]|nr:Uma2 family endonuclease [Streptomyces alkaliphilus]